MKFSVAMSVYKNDHAFFFDRALESITDQQVVKPSEIVLVVDGPINKELDTVIEKYQEKYDFINVIRLPQNVGTGRALQTAIENARYPLIARMDSDDISLPSRFEEQLEYFRRNDNLDIVGGDITEFIDSEDNVVAYRKVPLDDAKIKSYLKKRCPMNHVTVMYKKQAVQSVGGYQDLFWNEDYYLWIRMAEQRVQMANTGTVLVNVRSGADMYSRRGGKRYFASELFLQNYMLKKKMISRADYLDNVMKRWIVQIAMPNSLRGWVYRTFARKGQ